MHTRQLGESDRARLVDFFERHIETSMIPLANLELGGFGSDRLYAAEYFASFERSEMTAVVGHCWNGNLLVQGEHGLEDAARLAVRSTARPTAGVLGPIASVRRALAALDLERRSTRVGSAERLYSLELSELRVPHALSSGHLRVRLATAADRGGFLVDWRMGYEAETMAVQQTPSLFRRTRESLQRPRARDVWVLVDGAEPVSMTAFNAETRGIVQVGGVWTPPALRGRGYARCVVAASLLQRRARGAVRSILFTPRHNIAAQRCYEALGFRRIGEYGLWLFD